MHALKLPANHASSADKKRHRPNKPLKKRISIAAWLALLPMILTVVFAYLGTMVWTARVSMSNSRTFPSDNFVGFTQYVRLFHNDRWLLSLQNIVIYGVCFIVACMAIGLLLAIFIDQRVVAEGALRTVFLYPYAMSFVATGLVWQWILNPELGAQAVVEADTAGAAEQVAAWNNPEDAAVASSLAAELFGLDILRANVEDAAHNTTRFYVMSRDRFLPHPDTDGLMTTFVFRVRNVPAALYKALGGFATNGVNMTKLESYMLDGHFTATQFLCDVEGHPEQPALRRALEELSFFSREARVLGVYRMAAFRGSQAAAPGED